MIRGHNLRITTAAAAELSRQAAVAGTPGLMHLDLVEGTEEHRKVTFDFRGSAARKEEDSRNLRRDGFHGSAGVAIHQRMSDEFHPERRCVLLIPSLLEGEDREQEVVGRCHPLGAPWA